MIHNLCKILHTEIVLAPHDYKQIITIHPEPKNGVTLFLRQE